MNYFILVSGIFAAMAVVGHFTMGKKEYLKPVLDSGLDEIPKKIMHSLFHYASVFLVLSTIVLIGNSFDITLENCLLNSDMTVRFIGLVYLGFGLSQIIIAASSKIEGGLFKLFQWVFWLIIGLLALFGV